MIKITVLVENNSRIDNYLLSEPALSFYIEADSKKILFDAGYSDILLNNAQKLNLNLENLTDIILSHGHNDHTGGLKYLNLKNKNIKLTAHPNIFDKKYEPDGTEYGCPITKDELENKFKLNLTKNIYKISENIIFLGEIENNVSDDIDDSALVYNIGNKLLIITGCSHSGLENIIKYAKKVTGIDQIYGIIGGFHLLNLPDNDIEKINIYLKKEQIELIAPCHCCDLKSKIILAKNNSIKEICTGDIILI